MVQLCSQNQAACNETMLAGFALHDMHLRLMLVASAIAMRYAKGHHRLFWLWRVAHRTTLI